MTVAVSCMVTNAVSRFETEEINAAIIESYGNEIIDCRVRRPGKALNVNVSVREGRCGTDKRIPSSTADLAGTQHGVLRSPRETNHTESVEKCLRPGTCAA